MAKKGNKHRVSHGMHGTPEYWSWRGLKKRCLNPKEPFYDRYGGRGIMVCDRWLNSFENFYADMGPKPSSEHSIDRIDNNGNYEPGNCRWATRALQNINKSKNRHITANGQTLTIVEWERKMGFTRSTVSSRLKQGWSEEDAVLTPIRQKVCKASKDDIIEILLEQKLSIKDIASKTGMSYHGVYDAVKRLKKQAAKNNL